jgi:hypothetical protein
LAEETPEGLMIRLRWEGVENVPILLANQVIGQVGQQGEVILAFGQASPPILIGDAEQQREQAREIPFVPVKPVVRLGFTRAGLDDVIRILNETRDNWDKTLGTPPTPAEEGDEQ